jgi:uncharacterized phage infection (PIP) family protein YhgE
MPIKWLGLILAAFLLAACASQKGPAEKAVTDIEASLAPIRDDAAKYASTELQQVEDGLASLKDNLSKQDYKAVVAAAPAVSAQLSALQQTVNTKRAEAQAAMAAASDQWKTLSAEVPDMVSAIQSRVDILDKSKRLPKNVSRDAFQAAKDGLDFMKSTWAEATAAFGAGDPVNAVSKAQAVKDRGTEVLAQLGMGS